MNKTIITFDDGEQIRFGNFIDEKVIDKSPLDTISISSDGTFVK